MLRILLFGILTCLTTSCGYKLGSGSSFPPQATFYVPFVKEDPYANLTTAVIREINRSGTFLYSQQAADYTLEIHVTEITENHIGFRYEVEEDDEILTATNLLIPCEERLAIQANVKVFCNATGELVCGPLKFFETIDFDHDFYASHRETNVFSLGQFTEVEEAHDIALRPLYRRLAKRIVDDLSAI